MQNTVKNEITITGIGVHTGVVISITIMPAVANHGIVFKRVDIQAKAEENLIEARFDAVSNTTLCTVLSNKYGVSISTVEHLLAALYAAEIDNALIVVNNKELPILDGSAQPYLEALHEAGKSSLNAKQKVLRVVKEIEYKKDDKYIKLSPCEKFEIDYTISYPAPINVQKFHFMMQEDTFAKEVASARTFGFKKELDYLHSQGLAKGASLENSVGIDDNCSILNKDGLRFEDECVRHKVLDSIGDLSLCQARLLCRATIYKGGHELNNQALRALFADPSNYSMY